MRYCRSSAYGSFSVEPSQAHCVVLCGSAARLPLPPAPPAGASAGRCFEQKYRFSFVRGRLCVPRPLLFQVVLQDGHVKLVGELIILVIF
jgi:hypothetical protein